MNKINTYGIPMKNLNEISDYTRNILDIESNYFQLFYDTESGEVDAYEHCNATDWLNPWNEHILHIGNTRHHMSEQELADTVAWAISCMREEQN